MAVSDRRYLSPGATGVYGYLISLGIIAGVTVGPCYISALALLRQPAPGLSAAPPAGGRDAGGAALSPRFSAADGTVSQVAAQAMPAVDRRETVLAVSSRGPSGAKPAPPSSGPIARANARNLMSRSPVMPPSHPTGEKPPAAFLLADEEIAALTVRGDDLLRVGDIASARLYYERAADAGGEEAAFRMAATFEPLFLSQIGAQSMAGDPAKARLWYGRARALGASTVRPAVRSAATN